MNIQIVSIKMVKEKDLHYEYESISRVPQSAELVRKVIGDMDREAFVVITLDTKNHPTSINVNSIGNLNSSIVHPREVFKTAILGNAASILVGHNHPSGDTSPSKEDINVTNRLKEAGRILGIEVLDHIIVGSFNNYISLKEKGLL
ncbi:JAB domain-containing protein [Clostridium pasteurianum]|uniref:DNA repair protein n=1 Tax=Clostridium pasteurianum BC1 TaxID=86416 RepID=R4K0Q2_CLOPA|nr:JAB domain-containing protein [Clostridium pasteurianum]AGK96667.1 DNA repair protein [Clostridium pasteurianum BC1]